MLLTSFVLGSFLVGVCGFRGLFFESRGACGRLPREGARRSFGVTQKTPAKVVQVFEWCKFRGNRAAGGGAFEGTGRGQGHEAGGLLNGRLRSIVINWS